MVATGRSVASVKPAAAVFRNGIDVRRCVEAVLLDFGHPAVAASASNSCNSWVKLEQNAFFPFSIEYTHSPQLRARNCCLGVIRCAKAGQVPVMRGSWGTRGFSHASSESKVQSHVLVIGKIFRLGKFVFSCDWFYILRRAR